MSLFHALPDDFSAPPLSRSDPGRDASPLFRPLDWGAFWVVFLATLAVYTFTLAPTVTLEDSGELAVASDFLGVPHPPGYPIWTLLTWFFQWVFHFVTYHGHPNPAWGVAFCSAVSGAAACGVLALLVCRSASVLLPASGDQKGISAVASFASAVSAGLLLAFSPVLWSQSVIVEVYALNALFQMGVLLLVYLWMTHPKRDSLLLVAAFFFGLGLTNHQTLLFLGLALAVAVLMKDPVLFRDFAIPAILVGGVFVLAAKGVQLFVGEKTMEQMARMGADGRLWKWSLGPDNEFFWAYNYAFLGVPAALAVGTATRDWPAGKRCLAGLAVSFGLYAAVCLLAAYFHSPEATGFSSLLFPGFMPSANELAGESAFVRWLFSPVGPGGKAVLCWTACLLLPFAASWLKLPHGKTVAAAILLAEIGVAFYLYLPLASEQNPPMNWGYPRTWGGFMHAVTRGQYDAITPTDVFSEKFIRQLGAYLTDLRSQFSLPIALIGFLPFCAWGVTLPGSRRRLRALPAALAIFGFATLFIVLETLGMAGAAKLYRPAAGLLILAAAFGMFAMLAGWILDLVRSFRSLAVSTKVFVAGFFAALALALAWMTFQCVKAATADGATSLVKGFFLVAGLGPWAAIAATVALALSPLRLSGDCSEGTQRWLLTSVIGFLSVSVIFLIFQNPSLDLQSLFIGRVQFIQSHAFYAIWIGYGAAMGVNAIGRLSGRLRSVAALAVLALPAVLLWQNARDPEQLRVVGGAEQNGHTFGWQFGNWQLEGVKGIKEDFGYWYPDAEDFAREWGAFTNAMGAAEPAYPPPMGEGAVFFGGTDPGRFVPTYMIYSAEVRSDVYLITQNALADNTFMNVTRDLYGDTIYIPSADDSDQAFKKYVDDVSSGRLPAGADISVENGRVSVQGVQGVMTINGLLARLIFEGNKAEHEFFVEESYAIQWMYPYLTPNGLILKLNAEPLSRLPADVIENDHRFWGWYTEWLLSKSEFTRDICARKSFSKLRSAIAGVYEFRRNWAEAEYAYKQAVALYPLSPEAVLRLAQMYVNLGRFDDAKALLAEFTDPVTGDPHSDSAIGFLDQIEKNAGLAARRDELENKQRSEGGLALDEAVELLQIYRATRATDRYRRLAKTLAENPRVPKAYIVPLAQMLATDGQVDLLATALENYAAKEPDNANVWYDLAAARAILGQPDVAVNAAQHAIDLGGQPMKEMISRDTRFESVKNYPAFRRLLAAPAKAVAPAAGAKLPANLFAPPAAP